MYAASAAFSGFETTLPAATAWLKSRAGRPYFLFVHGYDVHGQYLLPSLEGRFAPGYDGRFAGTAEEHAGLRRAVIAGEALRVSRADRAFWAARYDEQVARADERVGRFLAALPAPSSSVLVAVMSDHGDELFEHGGVDHGMTLYDEVLRVPLLIAGPGVRPRRVTEQARLLDLAPTLLDLAGVADAPFAAQAAGVSLRPLLEGRPLPLDAVAETDFLYRARKRSWRAADGRKLILDLATWRREGYDRRSDPEELDDLVVANPSWPEPLERPLREALDLPGGGSAPVARVVAPLTEEQVRDGYGRREKGDFDAGRRVFEDAMAAEPEQPDYPHHLGALYGLNGDWRRALLYLEKSHALQLAKGIRNARYYHTLRWRGKAFHELGRDDEALADFDEVLARSGLGLYRLTAAHGAGEILLGRGRAPDAVRILERALVECAQLEAREIIPACPLSALLLAKARRETDLEASERHAVDALDMLSGFPRSEEHILAYLYAQALPHFTPEERPALARLVEERLLATLPLLVQDPEAAAIHETAAERLSARAREDEARAHRCRAAALYRRFGDLPAERAALARAGAPCPTAR